jgi:hypothetical protein
MIGWRNFKVQGLLVAAVVGVEASPAAPPAFPGARLQPFIERHCIDCHDGGLRRGDIDLEALLRDPDAPHAGERWARVHDMIAEGAMPPEKEARPEPEEAREFLESLAAALVEADAHRGRTEGRAIWRRLNRHEYENSVRDLLGAPWLQLRDMLPEDGEAHRFNKAGGALDISHIQMSRYLQAADVALRAVLAPGPEAPLSEARRYYAREQPWMVRKMTFNEFNRASVRATFPLLGTEAQPKVIAKKQAVTVGAADPETRELEAFGVVSGNYQPINVRFDEFKAPMAGRYKLRLKAQTFWAGPGEPYWVADRNRTFPGRNDEPLTLYAEADGMQRKLGSFDVTPEAEVHELEVLLLDGDVIFPDPARLFRSRPPNFRNPLATPEGSPGVAYRWLEVEGPLFEQWPPAGHRLLFGDLPFHPAESVARHGLIASADPAGDARRLLGNFFGKSSRRAVRPGEVEPFLGVVEAALATGSHFTDAMIAGYTAVLCSPGFLFLEESPGELDGPALAARLAYFLWNSPPDGELLRLAESGTLQQPAVLAAQTERMLDDPKSQRFVSAFLDYWLDLRHIHATTPDAVLYPDYYLDDLLTESAVDETRLFFTELLREDLPAKSVVDSGFTYVNERLAQHYGLPPVKGVAMRRVALPDDSPRGGLLTQASVLKVTANGTTTSPVLRGVWVIERILDEHTPPPPPGTPAVEPDIRGAATIREQLMLHSKDPSCASCHVKIDPPGFALENFDVFGGWRERYRGVDEQVKPVPGIGKNGQRFAFHHALPVDPAGKLRSGGGFSDIRGLKALLLEDERRIARNLAKQFVIYATGAPVRFGDRGVLEGILDEAAGNGYGVRSLVHGVVRSELFRQK